MSEVNEVNSKMIVELLDLLKKVASLEVQVRESLHQNNDVFNKTKKMIAEHQETVVNRLKSQDNLIQLNGDNLVSTLGNYYTKITNNVILDVRKYLSDNDLVRNYGILCHNQKALQASLGKVFKVIDSIKHSFDESAINPEELKKPDDDKSIDLYSDIKDYQFSVRVINCLKAERINTLNDLIQWDESRLLRTPNLGRRSLQEIKSVLSDLGLTLKKGN